jgi:deoxyribodipyrimidine photo-lyase
MESNALVWFRLDLRLADNPALAAAAARCDQIVLVFIWAPGAASRRWLHQSLRSLGDDLRRLGLSLILRSGPSLDALPSLVRECKADAVFWNRRYEPALRKRDARVQQALLSDGLHVEIHNSTRLFDPDKIKNKSGKPFLVFTPFWRSCLASAPDQASIRIPRLGNVKPLRSLSLKDLVLEPVIDWAGGLRSSWKPGETNGVKNLRHFLKNALEDYPSGCRALFPHFQSSDAVCKVRSGRKAYPSLGARGGHARLRRTDCKPRKGPGEGVGSFGFQ